MIRGTTVVDEEDECKEYTTTGKEVPMSEGCPISLRQETGDRRGRRDFRMNAVLLTLLGRRWYDHYLLYLLPVCVRFILPTRPGYISVQSCTTHFHST